MKNHRISRRFTQQKGGNVMRDAMLTELYKKVFEEKAKAEHISEGENGDRARQVAIAKNQLLSELIDLRTEQIRNGLSG